MALRPREWPPRSSDPGKGVKPSLQTRRAPLPTRNSTHYDFCLRETVRRYDDRVSVSSAAALKANEMSALLRSCIQSTVSRDVVFGSHLRSLGRKLRCLTPATSHWRTPAIREGGDGFVLSSPSDFSSSTAQPLSILLCGEGDFSFARALTLGAGKDLDDRVTVTATSFEPAGDIENQWGGSDNIRELSGTPGVELLHGIDATMLDTTFEGRSWDRICFMFPHIPGKGRISLNRELLAGFFRAAEPVLSPGGTVEVALVAGQGGTAADGDARREYGNTWRAATQAAEGGLVLVNKAPFDATAWNDRGYVSRGHWRSRPDSQERSFTVRDGVVHMFRREGELQEKTCQSHALTYTRDVSMWITGVEMFSEETLLDVVHETAGEGVDVEVSTLEVHKHEDGRLSRTIRIKYSSAVLAYTRARANVSQFALRDALEAGRVCGAALR